MARKGRLLAVNAGSSSLKISLYNAQDSALVLTSSISSISAPPAKFSFKDAQNQEVSSITDHPSAFAHFLYALAHEADIPKSTITHICHRVVHGGDYSDPVVIDSESFHHIEALSDLAPLHNGAALAVIQACISELPTAKSIAYFDTAFHRSIPPHISSYAINQFVAHEKGLKKYGFHGLSYASILRSVSEFLRKPPQSLNLIVLHLGSGASACAIQNGKSLDTSMGLTPLSGLPGATRSGTVDPSLIFHYTSKASRISHDPDMSNDLQVTEAEDILNKKSGWQALAGTTDFQRITERASQDPAAAHALDLFTDRILDFVGAYYLKLGARVDALVFSGGIGERSVKLREIVGKAVQCLGFVSVDGAKNEGVDKAKGVVVDIGEAGEKRVLVCRTDEQFEMARQCINDDQFWE